jgi:glutamate dehydrogenase
MLNTPVLSNQNEFFKQFQQKIFNVENNEPNKVLFDNFLREFYKYLPLDYIEAHNYQLFWKFAHSCYLFALNRDVNNKKFDLHYESQTNKLTIQAINTDKPFIVDSIKCLLKKFNLEINFLLHPVINVIRNNKGDLVDVVKKNDDSLAESIVYIEVYSYINEAELEVLRAKMQKVLEDVEQTSMAWPKILKEIDDLGQKRISKNSHEFLEWLRNDNFTFLGFIKIDLDTNKIISEFGNTTALNAAKNYMNNFISNAATHDIVVGNIDKISTVHKNKFIDYLLLVQDKTMHIILGFYGSNIQHQSSKNIPILAGKLKLLLETSGFIVNGYNYKKLKIVFESLPKEMLLQLSNQHLNSVALQILSSMTSQNVKVFIFSDIINTFAHVLVFIPRDKLSSEVQRDINKYLIEKLQSSLASDNFDEITKDFCYIYNILEYKNIKSIDIQSIEQDLIKITTSWKDQLKTTLTTQFGIPDGSRLFAQFSSVFPKDYQHKFEIPEAIDDISYIKHVISQNESVFKVNKDQEVGRYVLKIFNPQNKFKLSEILPILENLGFKVIQEQSFDLSKVNVWLHKFSLEIGETAAEVNIHNIEDIIDRILRKEISSDILCKLSTSANLNARQITILRALTHYLNQTGFHYDKEYVQKVLTNHNIVSDKLIQLFEAKFDLETNSTEGQVRLVDEINKYLEGVQNSCEDKILKYMLGIILAIVRTNAYQTLYGNTKSYISFKFDSSKVPGLPLPLPYAEIYVYAEDFEGVHLRGGKVARGGLRWSDRGEDYRTEALGLMKAQTTKNSIIVPVGSKGAFFVRNLDKFDSSSALNEYVVDCYKNFVRGLLDLTDNILNGQIIKPAHTITYDCQDPYLVVAADKGTASFSDYANELSAEYNFWLGDAFASGGSAGYDHKKIAITSRGAWVSLVDHLNNLNLKLEDAKFIGIGDMSGDVFGNGMLLSDKINLVAAFDHRQIFIDPEPGDSVRSFNERKRLFDKPKSKWSDYSPELISEGGGVFERSAKSIALSKQVQKLLNTKKQVLSPDELIKSLLTGEVDVIWNGGIGTYVKASSESNEEIGDKNNDQLRVNGKDLKAKIVVEGGNLGCSQRGRIEFALNGGKINTDFIDNSAGVDCSDHEVNIKICLASSVTNGKIDLLKRNEFLAKMTLEIADLVLADNFAQTQALTIRELSKIFSIEMFSDLIDVLEQGGLLNREVEFIPSKEELNKRIMNNLNLTRPEIAVLISYSKMFVYNSLIQSNLCEDSYFKNKILPNYFPKIMQQEFREEIMQHQLYKEIITTIAANKIINELSGPLLIQIIKDNDVEVESAVRAFFIVNEIFDIDQTWHQIGSAKIDKSTQIKAFTAMIKLIRRSINWVLKNYSSQDLLIESVAEKYKEHSWNIIKDLDAFLPQELLQNSILIKNLYLSSGLESSLADKLSKIEYAVSILDILNISSNNGLNQNNFKLAKLYFKVGGKLKLDSLRSKCDEIIKTTAYLSKLSAQTLKSDLYNKQRLLTEKIASLSCQDMSNFMLWYKTHKVKITSIIKFIDSLIFLEKIDINILVLANHKIQNLMEKIK